MPDGTSQSPFTFPQTSNGTTLIWSIAGEMTIDHGQPLTRGFDGNRANLASGEIELPARWPGQFGTVASIWVRQIGTGANATHSLALAFSGEGRETDLALQQIAHYWLVWRLNVGVQQIAFQYRLGSAQYPGVRLVYTGDSAAPRPPVEVPLPVFTWPNVDARLFAADTTPTTQPTFAAGIYAGTPGYEPLFIPSATENPVIADSIWPSASSTSENVSPRIRRPGRLRIVDELPPFTESVAGIRGTGETLFEFPRSFLRGIQSIKFAHDRKVDVVDSENNLQRTTYVHPGHRILIDLSMVFRDEGQAREFAGRMAPLGEAGVVRLALSELPNVIPQGGSLGVPLTLDAAAQSGATRLRLRRVAGAPIPNPPTARPIAVSDAGQYFVLNGITYQLVFVHPGRGAQLNSRLVADIPVGTEFLLSGGDTIRVLHFTMAGGMDIAVEILTPSPPTIPQVFPPNVAAGQIIQPERGRKLYSIIDTDEAADEIEIEPGLVAPLAAGAAIRTGPAVQYYMQPQGNLSWSKDASSRNIIRARFRFREVV